MYILNLTYKKSLEEVNKYLSAYNEYLQRYYDRGNFTCSGRKKPRTGGIILVKFPLLSETQEDIQNDPSCKMKLPIIELQSSFL